jgi:hypothetical protein
MQDLPLQGSIADIFFPRLIARLHRDGFEGAVRVSLGPTTKVVYFKRGEIASAASNAESDRLANLLIEAERLTQAQLDMAKSRMQPGGSLGKTLIEMGFLTPTELLMGARQQVREILGSCFVLSRGNYQIEPGPLPHEVTVLGLPTKRLVFDSLLQASDRQWIIREMGSMESVYRPTDDLVPGLNVLKLDIEMDRIGRMLDGTSSLRDISGRTSLDDFTVSKVVLALELLGMASVMGPPPAARAATGRTIAIESEGIEIEDEEPEAPGAPAEPQPAVAVDEAPPEMAAEPPPIPAEELPPFAFQPGDEPQWQTDPKTGERVHVGPIEVTFDGRVSSETDPGRRRLLLAVAGGAALVLAGAFLYLLLRRGGESPPETRFETPPPAEAATPGVEVQTAAAAPPGPGQTTKPRPDAGPPATMSAVTAPEAAPTPPQPSQPPAKEAPAPRQAPAGGATSSARVPAGPPPHGSISPFKEASRYAAALRIFDTGDADRAAGIFSELVSSEDAGRYTLQLMIACEVETLRTARSDSGERGSLYFLPFSLKGRDCYRVCWGNYPGREEAAAAELPAAFTRSGTRPVAVPLARLRPPT